MADNLEFLTARLGSKAAHALRWRSRGLEVLARAEAADDPTPELAAEVRDTAEALRVVRGTYVGVMRMLGAQASETSYNPRRREEIEAAAEALQGWLRLDHELADCQNRLTVCGARFSDSFARARLAEVEPRYAELAPKVARVVEKAERAAAERDRLLEEFRPLEHERNAYRRQAEEATQIISNNGRRTDEAAGTFRPMPAAR
jgi:chromosome segregation ATPase